MAKKRTRAWDDIFESGGDPIEEARRFAEQAPNVTASELKRKFGLFQHEAEKVLEGAAPPTVRGYTSTEGPRRSTGAKVTGGKVLGEGPRRNIPKPRSAVRGSMGGISGGLLRDRKTPTSGGSGGPKRTPTGFGGSRSTGSPFTSGAKAAGAAAGAAAGTKALKAAGLMGKLGRGAVTAGKGLLGAAGTMNPLLAIPLFVLGDWVLGRGLDYAISKLAEAKENPDLQQQLVDEITRQQYAEVQAETTLAEEERGYSMMSGQANRANTLLASGFGALTGDQTAALGRMGGGGPIPRALLDKAMVNATELPSTLFGYMLGPNENPELATAMRARRAMSGGGGNGYA